MTRRNILVAIGILALVGLIFVVPLFLKKGASDLSQNEFGNLPTGETQNFSIAAGQRAKTFPENVFQNNSESKNQSFFEAVGKSSGPATPQVPTNNFSESYSDFLINNFNFENSPITSQNPVYLPPTKERLELPTVLTSDLKVDETGAKNFAEYMDQVITLSQNITFPYEKFTAISAGTSETILFAEDLIDRAGKENNFSKYRTGLVTMKEFSEYKIGAIKEIKVTGEAIDFNQKAIAFEKLKIDLLEKAIDLADGKMKKEDFDDYYKKYNNTAFYYLEQFKGKYSGLANQRNSSFFETLADVFGLRKIAQAFLPLPFGGMISFTLPCPCSFGLSIAVGPPVPGKFFISAFGSRIYPFFKPTPGSWILGDYSLTPVPCLQVAFPVCVPSDFSQGVVIIAGTSL